MFTYLPVGTSEVLESEISSELLEKPSGAGDAAGLGFTLVTPSLGFGTLSTQTEDWSKHVGVI